MTASAIRNASEVRVGDRITEYDTPEGPFYVVLRVNAKSLLVDIGFDGAPEPLRLPVRASDSVRVAI